MSECRPSIMCLQETHFKNNHHNTKTDYVLCSIASGGVARYIDASYKSMQIPLQAHLQVVGIEVTLKQSLSLCNIYYLGSTNMVLLNTYCTGH